MKIIAMANQKGGVSKTTTTQAVVTLLNKSGKRTLCIDLDPQANLSFAMRAELEEAPTIYNVLKGELTAEDILQHTDSGDILPSNILLSAADTEFISMGREYLLKEAIQSIAKNYEYVLIDCPPALSILTVNAFTASDFIVVPTLADVFSLQGMAQLNNTIQGVKKYSNPNLKVAGILLTRFNHRTKLGNHIQKLLDAATKSMDTVLFKSYIRNSISVQESQYQRENILSYDSRGNAMADYADFLNELEAVLNA